MVESNQQNSKNEEYMLYVNFNQDNSCFAIGTEKGFHIYNTFPYKEIFSRSILHNPLELHRPRRRNRKSRNASSNEHFSISRWWKKSKIFS